jgi:hypothetical protein
MYFLPLPHCLAAAPDSCDSMCMNSPLLNFSVAGNVSSNAIGFVQ